MDLTFAVSIGKKYAIYLPRAVVKALNLREDDKVLLRVRGKSIIIDVVYDPIELALSGEKFASVTPEQVEEVSLEEQARRVEGTA